MELNVGQNLFEAIQAVTGHTPLESDMQQILSAVEKDNIDDLRGVSVTPDQLREMANEYLQKGAEMENQNGMEFKEVEMLYNNFNEVASIIELLHSR